jgi:hypothetical protein
MSYYNLKNSCISKTIALTSNEKFLLPFDTVYYKKYTKNTLMYPGHEENTSLYRPLKPDIIDNIDNIDNILYGSRDRIKDRKDRREKDDKEDKKHCKSC